MARPITAAAMRSLKHGPVQPLIERWRFFKAARPELYSNSFIKNAWAEIPEVVFFAGFYGLPAIIICSLALYNEDWENYMKRRPYVAHYSVMRPDDHRVKSLLKEHYERSDKIDD